MTAPEAVAAILRAANYLRQLSLEDGGTGTEAELADGLMEAVKVICVDNRCGRPWCEVCYPKVPNELASGG